MSVNLLPSNLKPSAGVQKIIKFIKNSVTLLASVFTLTFLGFAGVYVFNFSSIRNLDIKNNELIQRIEALENTEQSLYLLRDRIEKIQKIKNSSSLSSQFENAKSLTSFASDQITIESIEVGSDSIKFGVSSPTSKDMNDFLGKLQSSDLFARVRMEDFSFNQSIGFTANFTAYN